MKKEIFLNENERIDDLEINGFKIIQRTDGFCFGIDSVLLSDFAKKIKANSDILDFGTGTGIIGVLLCAKTKLKTVTGIEVQKEIANMAERTTKLNKLEDRFKIVNCNIKDVDTYLLANKYDAVVSNPPYKKINTGRVNENQIKYISRHEVEANLEDFVKMSFKMLKDKGSLYMVHRAERIVDIISILRANKMEPKRIRFVHSHRNEDSKLVLIEAIKNGKTFIKVEKPLYVYNDKNEYTDEIYEIYGKKKGEQK